MPMASSDSEHVGHQRGQILRQLLGIRGRLQGKAEGEMALTYRTTHKGSSFLIVDTLPK